MSGKTGIRWSATFGHCRRCSTDLLPLVARRQHCRRLSDPDGSGADRNCRSDTNEPGRDCSAEPSRQPTDGLCTDLSGELAQIVLGEVDVPWRVVDLGAEPASEREAVYERTLERDRSERFDLATPPLLRFTLITRDPGRHALAVTLHHILLDGWSMPLLMKDLMVLYATHGDESVLPRAASYRNYLSWLNSRDAAESELAWAEALSGSSSDPARRGRVCWFEYRHRRVGRYPGGDRTRRASRCLQRRQRRHIEHHDAGRLGNPAGAPAGSNGCRVRCNRVGSSSRARSCRVDGRPVHQHSAVRVTIDPRSLCVPCSHGCRQNRRRFSSTTNSD